jgi:hypothetical protein
VYLSTITIMLKGNVPDTGGCCISNLVEHPNVVSSQEENVV